MYFKLTIRSLIISDNSNGNMEYVVCKIKSRVRILLQVTIYRRLEIGRGEHLDQSEACDIS